MKILSKYLLTLLLFSVVHSSSWGQVKSYTIQKKLSTNAASSFWNQPNHGIKLNSYNTTFDIKVEVTTVDNINFQYFYPCILSPINSRIHNAPLTMFATAANQFSLPNSQGYINDWQGENPPYYYRSLFVSQRPCESGNVRPDTREFFKNQALVTRWTVFPFNILDKMVDVKIKVTLYGNIDINIIKEIAIPGVDPIYFQDFIKKTDYNANHGCFMNSDGVCQTYNDIRSILDLNAIDMKIQAHRGIWGKNNQENTIGAMDAADAYPLLESDIMPYGVANLTDSLAADFGKPAGLAAFHDFTLTRYSNGTGFILDKDYFYLKNLLLSKPRSNDLGTERILFYNQNSFGEELPETQSGLLGFAATIRNKGLLIDMKTIESFGNSLFTEFKSQKNKNISLFHNIALAISKAKAGDNLKYLTFKTYLKYNDLKQGLMNVGVSEQDFNKVLWAPIIADKDNKKSSAEIKAYLDDWFCYNESVLYYETNFFTDSDKLLANNYQIEGQGSYNVMEYIYKMSGRRAGIFSEEPVGGKGTVDRWGRWTIKNPANDRRGDHLWLLSKPFFKHAVITTDRPDVWIQLND